MGRVDPTNGVPLYAQLVGILRDKLETNELTPGSKLPSERELCEIYDISRITVRHAISQAEAEGLVERVHGMGTFVASPKYEQSLSEVKSFAATMIESGLVASTEVLQATSIFSDFGLARVLNLSLGSPVRLLSLRGMGNEKPRVIYDSYFAEDLGLQITERAQNLSETNIAFSTLDIHRNRSPERVTRMEQTFEATTADTETAKLLQIDEGWPIFHVESIIYGGEEPLEYRVARYRGDQYKFALERSIDLAIEP